MKDIFKFHISLQKNPMVQITGKKSRDNKHFVGTVLIDLSKNLTIFLIIYFLQGFMCIHT